MRRMRRRVLVKRAGILGQRFRAPSSKHRMKVMQVSLALFPWSLLVVRLACLPAIVLNLVCKGASLQWHSGSNG